MVYLLAALVVVAGASLWALRAAAQVARSRRSDIQWLPVELHDAELMGSEKMFSCLRPLAITVRIDRAYRARDGTLTLIEFKRRAVCRVHSADVAELSVQRYVLQRAGHAVNRRAYVVVVPPDGARSRALPVELEDEQRVEHRAARLRAILDGRARPNGPLQAAVCRGCGHRDVCPYKQAR
jgi:CRISPR/Cas system-associated exonuclease Cas4 (RecB family)